MKSTLSLGSLAFVTILIAACQNPDELTGHGNRRGGDGAACSSESDCASGVCTDNKCVGDTSAAALQCNQGPIGRSYALFDGSKMEDSRTNENVGVNRARVKPYQVLEGEFKRVLGQVPSSLKDSSGSFDSAPSRWFNESGYSGVSLHAIASIAFEGCLAQARADSDFSTAPTSATATTQCTTWMRKAWSRTPSPEEISGCVDVATSVDEPDPQKKWAYACTAVLSATQFLTF